MNFFLLQKQAMTQPLLVKITTLIYISIVFQSTPIFANCTCEPQNKDHQKTKHEALAYKLVSIASILCASALGIIIPILLNTFKSLQNDYSSLNFLIKAFAAGVILATGFIHILPDAFQSLTNPCLNSEIFGSFPFAGFVSMMSAIFTLLMESFATGYHRRAELRKAQPVNIGYDEENDGIHTHGQGHEHIADGPQILLERTNSSSLIRHRLISQILELGILVHSVIIGISLGTTENPKTIKPLIIALSFHQFFEGMGLGGCISEAKYRARTIAIMVLFFTLTTPSGIAIGMMISKGYNEQSSAALIVQGVLNSASAGILIYMALVDLLAKDFMDPNLHSNFKLQLLANVSLVLGASCMSLLAKWGGT